MFDSLKKLFEEKPFYALNVTFSYAWTPESHSVEMPELEKARRELEGDWAVYKDGTLSRDFRGEEFKLSRELRISLEDFPDVEGLVSLVRNFKANDSGANRRIPVFVDGKEDELQYSGGKLILLSEQQRDINSAYLTQDYVIDSFGY